MVASSIVGYVCIASKDFSEIPFIYIYVAFFLSPQVDTTEEARLLLDASDPTQCQTDSDDDLLHA